MKKLDLVGKKFGQLTVIAFSCTKNKQSIWECVCDCGNKTQVQTGNLRNGHTKSCGCKTKTLNGHSNTPTYKTYVSMIERCYKTTFDGYKKYGERGIKVCDQWRDSYFNFLEDMGERPEGMTLDRIDNNGNYCKENCRWATNKEQCRNRRNSFYITAFGKTQTVAAWEEETGVHHTSIINRFNRGLKEEEVFSKTRVNQKNTVFIKAFDKEKSLKEWSIEKDINKERISQRLKSGWTAEEALTGNRKKVYHAKRRFIEAFGKRQTSVEWARELGINRNMIECRLKRGWTPEEALDPKHTKRTRLK
jgi:hypothetical protein